jgi:hypothetical protein
MLHTVAGLRDRAPRPWTGSWTDPSVQPVRSAPSVTRLRGIRAGSAPGAPGRTSHNPPVVGSSPTRPTLLTCGYAVETRRRCRDWLQFWLQPRFPGVVKMGGERSLNSYGNPRDGSRTTRSSNQSVPIPAATHSTVLTRTPHSRSPRSSSSADRIRALATRCPSRSSGLIRWTVVDLCGRGHSPVSGRPGCWHSSHHGIAAC